LVCHVGYGILAISQVKNYFEFFTASDAVGYPLSPRQVGADFINELLTQDTRKQSSRDC